MINSPSIEELEKKTGIRFKTVIAVAKRAREISGGASTFYRGKSRNPLTIATNEIFDGSLIIKKGDKGNK
jgi:DNA-directed RNA polymerase omega subunit